LRLKFVLITIGYIKFVSVMVSNCLIYLYKL
jgi:hypothetical protein